MGNSSFRRHGLHTGPFARRAKVPWKECNPMDERLKFIARLLDGQKMAVVCREFGISRKTGYKILTRYNEIGLEGLTDRSRRPYRHANQLPIQIETQIVRLKQDKPSWGAPKIREKLARLYPVVAKRPDFLDKAVLQFTTPLAYEECLNGLAPANELGAVAPDASHRIGKRYFGRIARVPGVLRQARLLRGRF